MEICGTTKQWKHRSQVDLKFSWKQPEALLVPSYSKSQYDGLDSREVMSQLGLKAAGFGSALSGSGFQASKLDGNGVMIMDAVWGVRVRALRVVEQANPCQLMSVRWFRRLKLQLLGTAREDKDEVGEVNEDAGGGGTLGLSAAFQA